jgi:hypothetical protein
MTTIDFISELFRRVDDQMKNVPKHSQANLWPSEVVTLGLLQALKGVGNRAFYRWLIKDYWNVFPHLPERSHPFLLFKAHQDWTRRFLASPTLLEVVDTYDIELIHPIREGRSENQIGKKGKSNHRSHVGGKLCLILDQFGLVVDWNCDTAKVHDSTFQPLIQKFEDPMIIFGDSGFHRAEGDPSNLKICERGT